MKKLIFLFLTMFAFGVANAATYVTLPAGNLMGCPNATWVTNVVATSVDNNGTVHGQIEYVGYRVVSNGRTSSNQYSYMLYNATWDSTGTLVATVYVTKSCTAGNGLVGTFAVPNNQSYVHTYTNGYYTVTSQYENPGNPSRMRWVTTLSTQ
jgi:hypothetical protein